MEFLFSILQTYKDLGFILLCFRLIPCDLNFRTWEGTVRFVLCFLKRSHWVSSLSLLFDWTLKCPYLRIVLGNELIFFLSFILANSPSRKKKGGGGGKNRTWTNFQDFFMLSSQPGSDLPFWLYLCVRNFHWCVSFWFVQFLTCLLQVFRQSWECKYSKSHPYR